MNLSSISISSVTEPAPSSQSVFLDHAFTSPYTLIKAQVPIHTFKFSFRKKDWPETTPPLEKELSIYYHDDDFMIIDKPDEFLIDGDPWSVQEFLQRAYPQYPLFHLVHQLDFATSGIMTLAMNKKAASHACALFRRRLVRKEYVALVFGWLEKDYMEIRSPINEDPFHHIRMCIDAYEGKSALTLIRVAQRGYLNHIPATKVHLELHTGRRHQLRVHLASIGHPILGDPTYAAAPPLGSFQPVVVTHDVPRMYLHGRYLLLPLSETIPTHKDIAIEIEPSTAFELSECQCGKDKCTCAIHLNELNPNRWEHEAYNWHTQRLKKKIESTATRKQDKKDEIRKRHSECWKQERELINRKEENLEKDGIEKELLLKDEI